jgi:tetratricopeptide (TPR) repeat protein
MLDRLLAANPERTERVEMARLYFAWGKQLETKAQWAEASAAYSKAHGLDPKGAGANDALAAHHYALGKALEAQGKDGSPDFRRAIALKPDYAPAKTAAVATASARPLWMLYAAGGAGSIALLLFAAAMIKRRS